MIEFAQIGQLFLKHVAAHKLKVGQLKESLSKKCFTEDSKMCVIQDNSKKWQVAYNLQVNTLVS